MKDSFELQILPDGTIRTVYQDGIDSLLGATITKVGRASHVEWEEVPEAINHRFPATSGWSVRSAKDITWGLRLQSSLNPGVGERYVDTIVYSDNKDLAIALFESRERALEWELQFFWELLNGGESNVGREHSEDDSGEGEGGLPSRLPPQH